MDHGLIIDHVRERNRREANPMTVGDEWCVSNPMTQNQDIPPFRFTLTYTEGGPTTWVTRCCAVHIRIICKHRKICYCKVNRGKLEVIFMIYFTIKRQEQKRINVENKQFFGDKKSKVMQWRLVNHVI